ncbi:MAG: DUF2177 family protein, partial [Candidatus Saccharimonadales bacterium]
MNYVYAFFTSLVSMAVLDAVWLGAVAPAFYRKHIGFIMSAKPNWYAAVAFYLIFVAGLAFFVVYPGWRNATDLLKVGGMGAFFGLATYATYDLTNQATLTKWPVIVTVVDMI